MTSRVALRASSLVAAFVLLLALLAAPALATTSVSGATDTSVPLVIDPSGTPADTEIDLSSDDTAC